MDFCNKRYGLLHLPSLAVMSDRRPSSDRLRSLMETNRSPEETFAAAAGFSDSERAELAHRLTTRIHERRHFHDMLLTPVGNHLFGAALARSAMSVLLVKQLPREPGHDVLVPLGPETIPEERLSAHLNFERQYLQRSRSACYTLEASATIMQLSVALRDLKGDAFSLLFEDFGRDKRYGTALKCLLFLVGRLKAADRGRFLTLMNRLILIVLSNPKTQREGQKHDDLFATMLDGMLDKKPAELFSVTERACEKSWPGVETNLHLFGNYFATDVAPHHEKLYRLFGEKHQGIPDAYRRVAADFAVASREMRERVVASPDAYTLVGRYLQGPWCEPFEYDFPEPDALPQSRAKGGDQFSETWREFTYAYAPSGALMEPLDFLHPLQGPWLRQLERTVGVRFARRFKLRT